MKKQTLIVLTAAVLAGGSLAGCTSPQEKDQVSFGWQGPTLEVVHDNHNMPVTVDSAAAAQVKVSVTTTTAGKSATKPAWTLEGNTLDLDSPCKKGYVGMCEGRYTVTVPVGTKVKVNGKDTPVR